MRMVFRWFGKNNDSVSLEDIKQIPGVEGIVWALHEREAGEIWPLDEVMEVKKQAEAYGFHIDVVESINVHEDIKLGLPSRDYYIENYKKSIQNVAAAGAKVICYNFMPVFDWTRTDLFKRKDDGSTAFSMKKQKLTGWIPTNL